MALENGEIADADDVNDLVDTVVNVPIAGVVAFFASISGAPALPANFVACDGQTLDNDASPLDGQVIPNLNGLNSFLRGNSTSGATGGAATHVLTENEMPSHTHDINLSDSDGATRQEALGRSATAAGTETTSSTGGGAAHNNEPQYMDCVWVMRIY